MRKTLLAFALSLPLGIVGGLLVHGNMPTSHAKQEPHIIGFSPGGVISDFIEEYDELRRSGRPVILDSMCMSACTLVVGLIPADRLCTTPFGQLAFHSAWYSQFGMPVHSSEGTRLIWQIYPPILRQMLRERGWDGGDGENNAHPNMIYVEGADLLRVIRAC